MAFSNQAFGIMEYSMELGDNLFALEKINIYNNLFWKVKK